METHKDIFKILENNTEFSELLFLEKMFLSFVVDLLGIFKIYRTNCNEFISVLESIAEIELIPKRVVISNPAQIRSIFSRSQSALEQIGIKFSFVGEESDWEIVLESSFFS